MIKILRNLYLTRDYFRLKLSPTSGRCPWWLIFFKNLFYQKNCKEAMNIKEGQIRVPFSSFLLWKSAHFLHLPDAALSFYNNPCWHMPWEAIWVSIPSCKKHEWQLGGYDIYMGGVISLLMAWVVYRFRGILSPIIYCTYVIGEFSFKISDRVHFEVSWVFKAKNQETLDWSKIYTNINSEKVAFYLT